MKENMNASKSLNCEMKGPWDKGTMGCPVPVCPGTKGQRDVPSQFVPGRPMETLISTYFGKSCDTS